MSFGLLTPLRPEDIPRVMRRVAQHYRGTQTERYMSAWLTAADLLDKYADELMAKIVEIKKTEPRRRRVRL